MNLSSNPSSDSATSDPLECANCGRTQDAARCSFDMDLPTIVLCGICRITIVTNPELFKEMEKR